MNRGHHKCTNVNDGLGKGKKVGYGEKRLMKGSSHGNLANSFGNQPQRRNSIRRSKTDCDLRSLLLSDSLTGDYVTPYLRMKMQQRLKHKHGSKFSLHSSSSFGSSSIRSSHSTLTEQIIHHRSSKEVRPINNLLYTRIISVASQFVLLGNQDGEVSNSNEC